MDKQDVQWVITFRNNAPQEIERYPDQDDVPPIDLIVPLNRGRLVPDEPPLDVETHLRIIDSLQQILKECEALNRECKEYAAKEKQRPLPPLKEEKIDSGFWKNLYDRLMRFAAFLLGSSLKPKDPRK